MGLITLVLFVLFSSKSSYTVRSNEIVTTPSPTAFVPVPIFLDSDKVMELVQEWRAEQGYKKYTIDGRLCKIAEDRANDMFLIDKTDGHAGFRKKYYNLGYVVSENITGALNENEALDKWLNSPPHLEGLKRNYNYSCLKCKGMYCSQIFSNF